MARTSKSEKVADTKATVTTKAKGAKKSTDAKSVEKVDVAQSTEAKGYDFVAAEAAVKALCASYNDLVDFGTAKACEKMSTEISDKVAEYAKESQKVCYGEIAQADDPMKEAVSRLVYPAIAVKDKKVDGKTHSQKVVEGVDKKIDPLKLNEFVSGGIGHNKNWVSMCERMNLELTVRRAIELGIKPDGIRSTYAMSDAARTIEGFICDDDPSKFDLVAANEHLKANMQKCVDAMLGTGYEVTTPLVNFLLAIFSKKDNRKALAVTAANHKYMRMYMFEICHALVTGCSITMEYKTK